MIDRLKRSTLLRLCLVAFLTPFLVITSGSGAQASTAEYTKTLDIRLEPVGLSGILEDAITCLAVVALDDNLVRVHTGYCEYKALPEFMCEALDPACSGMSARFVDAQGASRVSGLTMERYDDGYFKDRVYISSGVLDLTSHSTAQLCIDLEFSPKGMPDATFTGCAGLKLETDAPADSACADATIRYQGRLPDEVVTQSNGWAYHTGNFAFDVVAPEGQKYIAYVLTRGWSQPATSLSKVVDRLSNPQMTLSPAFKGVTAGPVTSHVISQQISDMGRPLNETFEKHEVVGFGVYRETSVSQPLKHRETPWENGPHDYGLARLGVTDADACSFYWGEKVWDDFDPSTGADEPVSPLFDDPGEDPQLPIDEPEPAPDADTGWGWLDILIDAIMDIVGIIGGWIKDLIGAVGGVATAILDGLKGLFIPSEGFLDDDFEELRQDADDSNMGDWNEAFSGIFGGSAARSAGVPAEGGESGTGTATFAAGGGPGGLDFGGGGCQGPSIDIARIIPEGMGSQFDTLHPFAACEGLPAEMASWSRLLTGLFLTLFGAFKIFGMTAQAAIGMKTTEILRDFDWKSDRLDGRSL